MYIFQLDLFSDSTLFYHVCEQEGQLNEAMVSHTKETDTLKQELEDKSKAGKLSAAEDLESVPCHPSKVFNVFRVRYLSYFPNFFPHLSCSPIPVSGGSKRPTASY